MWQALGVFVFTLVALLFWALGVVRMSDSQVVWFSSGFPINWIIFPLLNE
jgi:hypothetical protein